MIGDSTNMDEMEKKSPGSTPPVRRLSSSSRKDSPSSKIAVDESANGASPSVKTPRSSPSIMKPKSVRSPSDESSDMRLLLNDAKRSTSSIDTSSSSDAPAVSIAKRLVQLQSIPANRSCADCRSPLVDSSQTFASYSPSLGALPLSPHKPTAIKEFRFHHEAFAPPSIPEAKGPIDPAVLVTKQLGGHGVFICSACAATHKAILGNVTTVRSLANSSQWTVEQVNFLSEAGGNARSWAVYERYLPEVWKTRRPTNMSTFVQRRIFALAKYEGLAFLTPQGGPLASQAWLQIVEQKKNMERWISKDLRNYQTITITESRSNGRVVTNSAEEPLPLRLVDFFCVIGHSGKIERNLIDRDLSGVNSPEDLILESKIIDCYPAQNSYSDMEFPEHVSMFVFPEGYRPSEVQQTPTLFTFVLTSGNGQRLYGAAMHVYEETLDTHNFRQILDHSGYKSPHPWWLHDEASPTIIGPKRPPEVVFMPKCLVVLSHYGFFDLWRRFLTQLYRITMVEAPLPIERYIANFVCEVPLPPPGKIAVKCGFTNDDPWSVTRPAINQLPLANFSYRPLFATLSVANIMVVMGCLMHETRVALLSRHYSLLGPVAEALLSLLFPFEWQGMYIPIMPYSMLDILDAPVPFLVGLHTRYLTEVKSHQRPQGVLYVDLDEDIVHMGFDDENRTDSGQLIPRSPPDIPERDAAKLKSKLEKFGGGAYLSPESRIKGQIRTGNGIRLKNIERPSYSHMTNADAPKMRLKTLSKADKPFLDKRLLTPISSFLSEDGQLSELDRAQKGDKKSRTMMKLFRLGRGNSRDGKFDDSRQETPFGLFDVVESDGFSGHEIRGAFLRFFVTIFNQYEKFLSEDSQGNLFKAEEFLASANVTLEARSFISKIISTQMFQRFLEERINNPMDPQILFFDESIVAKNNRSKKTTLTTGGKKETPFLDDITGKVTETFTPAPPSNWGLPDDGRSYQYSSFPILNGELFGKPRPPKQWPQETMKAQRHSKASNLAFAKQQELMARAFQTSVPTVLTNPVKPRARDMEWAILALSNVRRSQAQGSQPQKDQKDTSSSDADLLILAKQRLLSARRKQSILIEIITKIQACYRMYIARKNYGSCKKSLVSLQRRSRRTPCDTERRSFRIAIASVVTVQRIVRSYMAKEKYKAQLYAILLIQRLTRGMLVRTWVRREKAALLLQCWIRAEKVRRYISALRSAARHVQSITRGRQVRFAFRLLKDDIAQAQACIRGYLARKVVFSLVKKRASRYRQQVFTLWQRTYAPLSYRSKLWPMFDGPRFLRFAFLEAELERLWTELGIKFPRSQTNEATSLIKDDDHFDQASLIGFSNRCYLRFTKVHKWIESCREQDGPSATAWFPAEGSAYFRKAALQELAERLQIYERLNSHADPVALNTFYAYFDISPADKKKKVRLVGSLWSHPAYATRSSSVILSLFLELEQGTNIHCFKPSKKGKKRYRNAAKMEPLDRSMQIEARLDSLIRRDMREFAVALITKVPTLLIQIHDHEKNKSDRFLRQQRAAMGARGMNTWPRCRYEIIMRLLYPNSIDERF